MVPPLEKIPRSASNMQANPNTIVTMGLQTYLSFKLINRPCGFLKMLPYFWHASPTVGVYTIGRSSSTFSISSL